MAKNVDQKWKKWKKIGFLSIKFIFLLIKDFLKDLVEKWQNMEKKIRTLENYESKKAGKKVQIKLLHNFLPILNEMTRKL